MTRSYFPISAVLFLSSASLVVACGSRGPLDIGEEYGRDAGVPGVTVDAAMLVDAAPLDAAMPDEANDEPDAPPPRGDAGFTFDSGIPIVNCGACVAQACGTSVVQCIVSTSCRTILQCVATMCLAGGSPSPVCLLTCGSSDPQAAVEVIDLLQCVLNSCGSECATALAGGLGGGGTDAGMGGRMRDAGAGDQ